MMDDKRVTTVDDLPPEANVVTTEFLEKVLKAGEERDDIAVKDFTVSRATAKGDNYATVALRVHVSCQIADEEKVHHLIMKIMYDNDYLQTMVIKMKLFDKEVMAYKELCPAFIQYQKDRGVEPLRPSVPRLYYSVLDDKEGLVVLEDLCPGGYRMADKRKGLDYDHCKLVMKELAIFHALSYAMKDGNPENLKEKFGLAFFEAFYLTDTREDMEPFLSVKDAVDVFNAKVEDEETKERVKKLLSMNIFDTLLDFLKAEEPFSVICHGDVWCNNMIFKYNSETDDTPIDVKLLDLQITRYALPTTDLAYFFYTSTTQSVRQAHLTDLLQLYHKTFLDTLDHVKVKISGFTFEVLENMFKKTMLFGIINGCVGLPQILCKAEDVEEIKAGQTREDVRKMMDGMQKKILAGNSLVEERIIGVIQDAIDAGVL